jgi:hypothetical protein
MSFAGASGLCQPEAAGTSRRNEEHTMPQVKKTRPKPVRQPKPQPAAANVPPAEVLTLAEAAAFLQLPEREVIAAATAQGLPGRQVGSEWRFLKTAIQQWQPPAKKTSRKAARPPRKKER